MEASSPEDQIHRVRMLDEPIRLALYRYIRSRIPAEIGRDEAARAVRISRNLAAFHLDRLVAAGLLETSYKRLSGRQGPGAGRPAKVYRPAKTEVAISVPERRYDLAARILASALRLRPGVSSGRGLRKTARDFGRAVGAGARSEGLDLQQVLSELGFEPVDSGEEIRTRNCPFERLSQEYGLPVCEMNLAFQDGLLDGLGRNRVSARLTPEDGYCCVTFQRESTPDRRRSAAAKPRSRLHRLSRAFARSASAIGNEGRALVPDDLEER